MSDFDPRDNVRQLRGKGGGTADYLDVKDRIRWFRSDYPEGHIETFNVSLSDQVAVFRCLATKIKDGVVLGMASGHGSETPGDFKDYIEKAETKAIGRALAALGYGTQFLPDDGDRIADSPVEQRDGLDPRVAKRLDKVATDLVEAVRRVDSYQDAPVTPSEPRSEPKSTRSGNVIPKTAPMVTDDAIKGFYKDIESAPDSDALYLTGQLISQADINDEGLRAAYRKRMAAFNATS